MSDEQAITVDGETPAEPLSADQMQQLRDGLMILQGLAICSLLGRRKGVDRELMADIHQLTTTLSAQQPKSQQAPPT